jgi:hypothetical protein
MPSGTARDFQNAARKLGFLKTGKLEVMNAGIIQTGEPLPSHYTAGGTSDRRSSSKF